MLRISIAKARKLGLVEPVNDSLSTKLKSSRSAAIPLLSPHLPEPTVPITVEIPGRPVAKQGAKRGKGNTYKPSRITKFEAAVRGHTVLAMRGFAPLSGPVGIEVVQYRQVGAGFSKAKKAAALAGLILPDVKPDFDNLEKSLMDGLKTVAFEDDAQICASSFKKVFGLMDKVVVRFWPLAATGIRKRKASDC